MASQRALAAAIVVSILAAVTAPAQVPGSDSVPQDLRPLLAPHRSEMRLVLLRYSADRSLLAGNYAGNAGRGGGRGGPGQIVADTSISPLAVSPNRIARLKQFDTSWQVALGALSSSALTPAASTDLDSLRVVVAANVGRADADATDLARHLYIMPFAPELVSLLEERLQLHDVNSERAAGMLTEVVRSARNIAERFRAGLRGDSTGERATPLAARRAASAIDALRRNLTDWYNFYNGYDPVFTWWMGLPFKHADSALTQYATLLRDSVAAANQIASAHMFAMLRTDTWRVAGGCACQYGYYGTYDPQYFLAMGIPYAAPRIADYSAEDRARQAQEVIRAGVMRDVPDLNEIITLPQDEMTDIVNRYLGRGANLGGRDGRGGQGAPLAFVHDSTFYQNWLVALKTLDFDHLTRNAQVDYLYLKKLAELKLARQGPPLPTDAPRKTDNSGIPGGAAGRDSLIRDLQDQLIPYTPEQLMALAEKEFAWTTAEMIKASRQMGFGDNWKLALEKTKTMHVPPGGQPGMIRDLIYDAIDYLRVNDLISVSRVASESMRMSMMSAQSQLANPFFLGGSEIQVSFPTDGMEFDAREQGMRGNNRPWSHATAFHEMIPGHNLSGYVNQRFSGYRANVGSGGPFYNEGWALYWELILYDKGFDRTPEEKVGALFWRMHRCARIIFSLKFHMGQWSPQQAVDLLVDRVGHERDNARAEVNRSFRGGYGPLYQAAYLLGGLELRGLRKELVDSKQMTEKAFHDEILRQGSMPIALLRLGMTRQQLTRDMDIDWKFYGELPDH